MTDTMTITDTMTTDAADVCARRTADALVTTASLLSVLTPPIRVPLSISASGPQCQAAVAQAARMQGFLDAATDAAGTPRMTLVPAAATRFTSFEIAVAARLPLESLAGPWAEGEDQAGWSARIPAAVADARANGFATAFKRTHVRSFDGTVLRVYTAGRSNRPAVLIIAPCGMPAELCEAWLRALGETHFVVTWETRGLFGGESEQRPAAPEIASQVDDIFALLDHFLISTSHLMGICGGAVPALLAASRQDHRIRSLSVWHGDFELGPECARTLAQVELQAVLATAAQGLERARVIHQVFRSARILEKIPADLAHLLLYPYANPDILFRYAILNGAIMGTNVSTVLRHVVQPTLVVTSRDDNTAHPEGSRRVAEGLCRSTLRIEATGDHLSVFAARPGLTDMLRAFLAEQS